ncbi:hypothetical protein [Bradyrhizobium sp. 27S5]|uniref:hypothetical protein n=1 Tax=Bradyrhizobium sp. 27S5 TaxID=3139728 RepID=UPI0030D43799
MRVVAKFQFLASDFQGGGEKLTNIIQKWGQNKFDKASDGRTVIRKSRLSANFDRRVEITGESSQTTFDVVEPIANGQLQTRVKILETSSTVNFQCALSVASDGGLIPPGVNIRSPRFIRDIVDIPAQWRVAEDAERLFAKCFDVKEAEVETLRALISASQRRFPQRLSQSS